VHPCHPFLPIRLQLGEWGLSACGWGLSTGGCGPSAGGRGLPAVGWCLTSCGCGQTASGCVLSTVGLFDRSVIQWAEFVYGCFTYPIVVDGILFCCSLNCCCLGCSSKQLIGGFEDSSIHVWCLCGCSEEGGCLHAEHSTQWEDLCMEESLNTGIYPSLSPKYSCHATLHGHSGPVYSVTTTQNGCHLFSASEDTSVRLWDLTRSNCVAVYKGHSYPVFDVALSSLGVHFATASYDRTARLWSCDSTYPIRMFAGHNSSVDVVRFHGNCNYIATGSSDRTCRLWDVQSGQCVRLFSSCKVGGAVGVSVLHLPQ
jgi:WD40 repeat protein